MPGPRPYVRPLSQKIQRGGADIKRWVELGASIQTAASLCDVSESQLYRWTEIAREHPDSLIGQMLRGLKLAESQAAVRYPNGQHSRTGNIVGGQREAAASPLVSWDD
jgi:hypothetical protein